MIFKKLNLSFFFCLLCIRGLQQRISCLLFYQNSTSKKNCFFLLNSCLYCCFPFHLLPWTFSYYYANISSFKHELMSGIILLLQLSTASNGSVQIVGTSGVAAAMGFYYYLKYYCKGQRTWAGQQTQLPPTLPVIGSPVKISTNDKYVKFFRNHLFVFYFILFTCC